MKLCFLLLITFVIAKAASVEDSIDPIFDMTHINAKSIDNTNVLTTTAFNKPMSKIPNLETTPSTSKNYHIVPYLKSNWLLANMYCNKIGMRLISISTMEDYDAILKAIQNVGLSGAIFWTTGRRVDHTMYWFATGTKLNFTNWGQNEPFNRHTMQECIGIQEYDKLTWIDVNCDYNLRIMCEEDRPQKCFRNNSV